MTTKLPAYFEKYFDEKFTSVDKRFDTIETSIDNLKKSVSGSTSRINKLWIGLGILAIVLLIHFGETSGDILNRLFGFL